MQYFKIKLLFKITFLSKIYIYISRSYSYSILCDLELLIMIFPKKDLNKPRLVLTLSKLEHALHLFTYAKCLELI